MGETNQEKSRRTRFQALLSSKKFAQVRNVGEWLVIMIPIS